MGELALGQEIVGDTRGAVDDLSASCSAPGPDHDFVFTVTEAGRYRARVDAEGWRPVLAIGVAGLDSRISCGVGPAPGHRAETEHHLRPGRYRVTVDGPAVDQAGPYRLRVDRTE